MILTIDCAEFGSKNDWFGCYTFIDCLKYNQTEFMTAIKNCGSLIILKNFHKTTSEVFSRGGLLDLFSGHYINIDNEWICCAKGVRFWILGNMSEVDPAIADKLYENPLIEHIESTPNQN